MTTPPFSMNSTKHYNIPIFIPQLACPFQCVYCNQRNISGIQKMPGKKEIIDIIELHLSTIPKVNSEIEVAFFGGNFTGIPKEEQIHYLEIVKPFIDSGVVSGIRLSTRPDYINEEILDLLKKYGVISIELGAQSMDDEVLKLCGRGYTSKTVAKAGRMIIEHCFSLGLQMMIGLPGDTIEKSVNTAKAIASVGADNTRIYPTLVIKDTELATLYSQKKYEPLSLEDAVEWAKEVYKVFETSNVKVLRMGLHPSEGLISRESLIAGPFHISFGELVMTALWKETFSTLLGNKTGKNILIKVPPAQINNAIGYKAANKIMIEEFYKKVKFISDPLLKQRNFECEEII